MTDTIHSCPQCATVYFSRQPCDWCAVETQPVVAGPALPAEVWAKPQPVDYMAAVRAMCGRQA